MDRIIFQRGPSQERSALLPTKRPPLIANAPSQPDVSRGGSAFLSPIFSSPFHESPVLIIMLAAFAVLVPTFFLGIPSGHDFEFHLNSWMEVLSQWKLGILYPRWAALAHYGFGEPRFVFYPPTSWTLGAMLGIFLPWKIVPGVYEWVALTLSGCSMFLLGRRFLERRDAIFAAALYAANPYHIVIVYWRSAFAELLAGALLPLLLLYVLRSEEEGSKTILPLGLIVATAWLTNVPAAVMLTYSLVLLAVVVAVQRRSPQLIAIVSGALVLGFALSSFYLVPAAYEQKWVEIEQVLSPGVRPQDNFLFTFIGNADHDRFNLLISLLTTAQILLMATAGFLSRRWRSRVPQAWWALVGWGTASAAVMLSFSFLLYRILPEIRFVQLPLRWLLCLNVAFVLLLTMALRQWLPRALACVVVLAVLVWVWHRVQPPWWDTPADIAELQDNQQSDAGYEGTDEYVPTGADSYEIKKDAHQVIFEGDGSSRINVSRWAPESRSFTARVSHSGKLVLKLFNYPAWKVEVNGHPVTTGTVEVTGQMVVPVETGENRVQITFTRTADRTIGGLISFGTGILVLGWVFFRRRTPMLPEQP
ncbi:MAG: 6-pyruvoyl-tetrahydropterin synthase-related protein [Bdellovibrionota bacterium]